MNVEVNKMNQRVAWIDYMSGIGTLLVFMQHSCVPIITRLILGFHMPLFFWISGLLYQKNRSYNKNSGTYIRSRVKRLIIPYLFWFVVDKTQAFIMRSGSASFDGSNFMHEVLESFLFSSSWFLPCLFFSELIFHAIHKALVNSVSEKIINWKTSLFGALAFWGLSWLENTLLPGRMIFGMDTCLMALGFMFFGSASCDFVVRFKRIKHNAMAVIAIFLSGGGTLFVILNSRGGDNFMMFQNKYGNYLFAIIGAVLLIWALYFGVNAFDKYLPKNYLFFLRDNGVLLFVVHISIISMVKWMFPVLNSYSLWISSIISLLAIHLVAFPLCVFVNKYMPWVAGK